VHRISWYLAVRRPAVWQAVGVLVLLAAGPLAWFGVGVALFVGVLAWRGWTRLPDGSQVSLAMLFAKVPTAVIGGAALGLSVVALMMWIVAVALGAAATVLLLVSFVCALVAAVGTSLGLRRMWTP